MAVEHRSFVTRKKVQPMCVLVAQASPAVLLDTLVKLASLGAGGVCVLAIFWVGWLVSRMQPNASAQQHRTVRLFMGMTIVIAIIAFASGLANAWFNASVIAKVEQEGKVALAEQIKIKEEALKLEAETKNQFESYQKSAGQKIAALQEKDIRHSEIIGSLTKVLDAKELAARETAAPQELKRHIATLRSSIERFNGIAAGSEPPASPLNPGPIRAEPPK
jgi:hypothetical protein